MSMDNPGLSWWRGNLAPTASIGFDLITGKNFVGDPTRDGMLSFTKALASRLLPKWSQSILLEGGNIEGKLARGAASFFGLRARSISKWEQWTAYVEQATGMKYDTVAKENRDVLNRLQTQDAQGAELYQAWSDDAAKRGRLGGAVVAENKFRADWQDAVSIGADWLAAGKDDKGNVFLEPDLWNWVWDNSGHLAEQLGTLRELPVYKDYYAELEKRPTKEGTFNDAWAKYWEVQFDPALDTAFGYNYDKRDENLIALREQVGEEMWARVLKADKDRWATLPDAIRNVRDARDGLRDYYEVDKQLLPLVAPIVREKWLAYSAILGDAERNKVYAEEPLVRAMQALVEKARVNYRQQHPDIDVLLIRYGMTTKPASIQGFQEQQRQRQRVTP